MSESDRFHADGYEDARSEYETKLRNEITSKYADEMETASWVQRRRLRKQINNEITERLDDLAPPDALY